MTHVRAVRAHPHAARVACRGLASLLSCSSARASRTTSRLEERLGWPAPHPSRAPRRRPLLDRQRSGLGHPVPPARRLTRPAAPPPLPHLSTARCAMLADALLDPAVVPHGALPGTQRCSTTAPRSSSRPAARSGSQRRPTRPAARAGAARCRAARRGRSSGGRRRRRPAAAARRRTAATTRRRPSA